MIDYFRKSVKSCSDFLCFKKSHQFIAFIFLLPVFFVLHTCNDYFGLIRSENAVFWLLRYLLLSFIVVMGSLFFLRSPQKAFLFSFFCLCLFFFFGAFHDFIKGLNIPSFFCSYSFLLPFIGVAIALLFGVLLRVDKPFRKITRFCIFFIFISLFIDLFLFAYYSFSHREKQNSLLAKEGVQFSKSIPVSDSLPDIFFLIMDGYTNSTTLRSEFDYANDLIDSAFYKKGFFLPKHSYSNYYSTALSLASMMDLNYLEGNLENSFLTHKQLAKGVASLEHVGLLSFLKNYGYEYLNYGAFTVGDKVPVRPTPFALMTEQTIPLQTLWGRMRRDILWVYYYKDFFTGKFKLPASYYKEKNYQISLSEVNYNLFLNEIKKESSDAPKFVYGHMMTTHWPFYLDSIGNPYSDTLVALEKIDKKKGYVGQVIYSNDFLKKILDSIDTNSTRPKVVLIFGDHGVRLNDRKKWPIAFSCLSAVYFSDGDYQLLSDKLSSVNVFRIVLNKYFNQQLPLLEHRVATPDSIYYDW